MKRDIHPDYHPVVFQDSSTGTAFLTRSTATSAHTIEWTDGTWNPEQYYRQALWDMAAPGPLPSWQRVMDYYHAAQYLRKPPEAQCGPGALSGR